MEVGAVSCRIDELDACGFETQILDVTHPSDGQQDLIDCKRAFDAVADQLEAFLAAFHASADDRGIQSGFHAVP